MPEGWYEDTDADALRLFLKRHRAMTPGERLARIFEMAEFQEALQQSSVRAMYPDASEREVFLRVAARRLGREMMIRVYGWDPDLRR